MIAKTVYIENFRHQGMGTILASFARADGRIKTLMMYVTAINGTTVYRVTDFDDTITELLKLDAAVAIYNSCREDKK